MNPFRNILRLSVGDFFAKSLNFLAFVYLARALGVESYGILEFAISILAYFLLFADGGLELWSTREIASGKSPRKLVARILPLRVILAFCAYAVLCLIVLFVPHYPNLRVVLLLFGLTLFAQAINLKWVFMGQERMTGVAIGLVVAQLLFASAIFLVVQNPSAVIWVPLLRLASDFAMAIYFGWLFARLHGGLRLGFTLRKSGEALRPALTLGTSHGLALMNYNFDAILVGLLLGPVAVGWYSAAYKPVTMVLAMPTTYFIGLFPALSRAHSTNLESFREIATRSLGLAAVCSVPIGVGGLFLAAPIITFLFGPAYANAIPVLQILCWSAVLVILRGTFRQALNSAGRSRLDLRCASASVMLNITLNVLLIPRYNIVGAAIATVVSEVLWFSLAYYYFSHYVAQIKLLPLLRYPILAAIAMGTVLLLLETVFWGVQALIGLIAYFGVLFLLGEKELRFLFATQKARLASFRVS